MKTRIDPLYGKAPLVLLRFPALLGALALGVGLLALVTVLYPLGVSAAGNRFLRGEMREGIVTRYGMGITYENENVPFDKPAPTDDSKPLFRLQEELFEEEIGRIPALGPVLSSVRGPQVEVSSGRESRAGRLFYREGAEHHVEVIEGEPGHGVLIADSVAEPLGVRPGDRITLTSDNGPSVRVTVDAIYAALYREPAAGFWRPWRSSIYPSCPGDPGTSGCEPPPAFILAGKEQVIALSRRLGSAGATFGWDAPLRDPNQFTLEKATDLQRSYTTLATRMSDPASPLYDVFLCCGPQYVRETRYLTETRLSSVVQQVSAQAEARLEAAEVPLRLLQMIALLVSIGAIGAAAVYSFSTRHTEVNLFYARGYRPVEVGIRSALEASIVSVIAVAVGSGAAVLIVRAAARGVPVSEDAMRSALLFSAALVPFLVIGLGLTAGVLFRRWTYAGVHARRQGLVRGALEIALVGVSIWLLGRTFVQGGGATSSAEWTHVVTPLAILTTSATMAARLLEAALRRAARSAKALPHPLYLAVRRAAAGRSGFLLFTLAATFFGVFQHGLSIASMLEDTVVAKSRLFVGSDVSATVDVGDVPPTDLGWPASTAWRIPHVNLRDSSREVDVIAVDPETLNAAAYWDPRFGANSVSNLMGELEGPAPGNAPAIYVGETGDEMLALDFGGVEMEVSPAARVDAFPGMLSRRPAVVISQKDLRAVVEDRGSGLLGSSAVTGEWWIRGDPDAISAWLPGLEDPPYAITTAEEVRDIPYVATTLATFRILDVLGLIGAALVIVAALTYIQSRERARAVSSHLGLRMGMDRRSHAVATVIELGFLVVVAYAIALVPAALMARVLAAELDPLRTIPPDVLLAVPRGWIALGLLGAVTASVVGGTVVARRALSTDMAHLMRVAD